MELQGAEGPPRSRPLLDRGGAAGVSPEAAAAARGPSVVTSCLGSSHRCAGWNKVVGGVVGKGRKMEEAS